MWLFTIGLLSASLVGMFMTLMVMIHDAWWMLLHCKRTKLLEIEKIKMTLLGFGILAVLFYFLASLLLLYAEIGNYSSLWNNEYYIGVSTLRGFGHLFGCLFHVSSVFLTFKDKGNMNGFAISNIISYSVSIALFIFRCWLAKLLNQRFLIYYNDCNNIEIVKSLILINSFEVGGQIAVSALLFIAFNINFQQLLLGMETWDNNNNDKNSIVNLYIPTKVKCNSIIFNLINATSFIVSIMFIIGSRLMFHDWLNLPYSDENSPNRKNSHAYCVTGLTIACLFNSLTILFGLNFSNKFKMIIICANQYKNKCYSCKSNTMFQSSCNNLSNIWCDNNIQCNCKCSQQSTKLIDKIDLSAIRIMTMNANSNLIETTYSAKTGTSHPMPEIASSSINSIDWPLL